MKKIMMMRHAKSAHKAKRDKKRRLTDVGHEDAQRIGRFLKDIKSIPMQIISSPARRARETTEEVAGELDIPSDNISWNSDFYSGTAVNYLQSIQQANKEAPNILLVGHNPKISEALARLCSQSQSSVARMNPATLVCLEHPAIAWDQIRPGSARLRWMVTAELLGDLQ